MCSGDVGRVESEAKLSETSSECESRDETRRDK